MEKVQSKGDVISIPRGGQKAAKTWPNGNLIRSTQQQGMGRVAIRNKTGIGGAERTNPVHFVEFSFGAKADNFLRTGKCHCRVPSPFFAGP